MDGYAVRAADVPGTLKVIGEVPAGGRAVKAVGQGEAMAIMTGAPVPDGADTVVPIEDCQPLENGVRIDGSIDIGKNIARRGADCAASAILLKRGMKLESAQLAVAASVGARKVQAFAAPRVAVLSTGDELVEIGAQPGPSQIRNSNNIMLVALLRRLGCDVKDLGFVRDDPQIIRGAIEKTLSFDMLFITGGMSMGRYDYVPKILIELEVELKITKLRIKPGKPFVFGVKPGKAYVFGLPGNPVSSFVCTLRLASRLIARMSGAQSVERWNEAQLESPLEANGVREFYLPAILAGCCVQPLKWKGSADIYTLARANALIVRPGNADSLSAGAIVRVLEIPS
jgi:molybdopterin molybdotransferase